LSWTFCHAKIPWEHFLVPSVRVVPEHHGITSGCLVVDESDNKRSKSLKTLVHLYKLRDKERDSYLFPSASNTSPPLLRSIPGRPRPSVSAAGKSQHHIIFNY
jgi:hypothetical protein